MQRTARIGYNQGHPKWWRAVSLPILPRCGRTATFPMTALLCPDSLRPVPKAGLPSKRNVHKMRYRYSNIDRNNLNWMRRDNSVATLLEIKLTDGSLRGIRDLNLSFKYPISAVAGRNASGKSTVLALAACAYHNREDGYHPQGRKQTYYTFSDFFVQSPNESVPSGIVLRYQFLYNNWRGHEPGPRYQIRTKRVGAVGLITVPA